MATRTAAPGVMRIVVAVAIVLAFAATVRVASFPMRAAAARTSSPTTGGSYAIVTATGALFAFTAPTAGTLPSAAISPARPVRGIAADPLTGGYWLATAGGGVFSFGAPFDGSLPGIGVHPAQPIVGIAADPLTGGYWLATAGGGVFSFGAPFDGSVPGIGVHPAQPIVGIAADPLTGGYWLATAGGGVFGFGAPFDGSLPGIGVHPAQPIVGIAADPLTGGYRLATANGAVFSFGAPPIGTLPSIGVHPTYPVTAIAADPASGGYWLATAGGGVFSFGAPFRGSLPGLGVRPTVPVVGLAAFASAATAPAPTPSTPRPQLTSISPASGPVIGGTSVTISGIHLATPTAVHFGAAASATFAYSPTSSSITATSPPGTAGTSVAITVSTAAGTSTPNAASAFTYDGALTVATSTLPDAVIGTSYRAALDASGGATASDTWSVASGSLPAGLTLSAGGVISGTPTVEGTGTFSVEVADGTGEHAAKSLSIAVAATALVITTASLQAATVGVADSSVLSASGGTSRSYTWTTSAGALPAGLSLSASGTISGTPTTLGTSTFTVKVTDAAGTSTTRAFSMDVAGSLLAIATSSLPAGTVDLAYSATLRTTGGTTLSRTWSVASGSLPSGLALSTAGAITGTPTADVTSTFTVAVTDGVGQRATASLSIKVSGTALTVTTASLASALIDTSYSASLSASGGTTSRDSWYAIAGSLPPGVYITPGTGVFHGTLTGDGTFTFTVQVTDGSGQTATKQLSITVSGTAIDVTTTGLTGAAASKSYSDVLAASGGTTTTRQWSWAATSGSTLPGGLKLSTGDITGSPTQSGNFYFTVTVTDGKGQSATKALALNVQGTPLVIDTASPLAPATVGSSYSATLYASGGTTGLHPTRTWTLALGSSLPNGLTLSTTGAITGTPSVADTFAFTVTVRDGSGQTATKQFSLTVT